MAFACAPHLQKCSLDDTYLGTSNRSVHPRLPAWVCSGGTGVFEGNADDIDAKRFAPDTCKPDASSGEFGVQSLACEASPRPVERSSTLQKVDRLPPFRQQRNHWKSAEN